MHDICRDDLIFTYAEFCLLSDLLANTEIENKPHIPKKIVLPVKHALQGHPESPRLWSQKIHSILIKLGCKNTTHEPCLYTKTVQNKPIFFLRQVDDFLISAQNEEITNREFDLIQKSLKEPMKRFGRVTQHSMGLMLIKLRILLKYHARLIFEKY